jgi:hypothetical protein
LSAISPFTELGTVEAAKAKSGAAFSALEKTG